MAAGTLSLAVDVDVDIPSRGFDLPGRLVVPERARGLVVFAHDAHCDGRTPGDRQVAHLLHELGFGTLLFDLSAGEEVADAVFDVDVLAVRLLLASRWLRAEPTARSQPVGYLGLRGGAAVALLAAAEEPSVGAVVVRGGPIDVGAAVLAAVQAPTLFVVGGTDPSEREADERTASQMTCTNEVVVAPRAGDEFAEPRVLDASARLAGAWFLRHLRRPEGHDVR